jgi:hypothetical protein
MSGTSEQNADGRSESEVGVIDETILLDKENVMGRGSVAGHLVDGLKGHPKAGSTLSPLSSSLGVHGPIVEGSDEDNEEESEADSAGGSSSDSDDCFGDFDMAVLNRS